MFKRNKIIVFFLGVTILILTLLRENIFLEINAIINGYSYNNAYFYFFDATISKLSLTQLLILKWSLTVGFIVAISGLTLLSIRIWFKNKSYTMMSFKIYLIAFLFVILMAGVLWMLGCFNEYYFIIRKIVGLIHSPLPLFLFFSVYIYTEKVSKNT